MKNEKEVVIENVGITAIEFVKSLLINRERMLGEYLLGGKDTWIESYDSIMREKDLKEFYDATPEERKENANNFKEEIEKLYKENIRFGKEQISLHAKFYEVLNELKESIS